MVLLESVRILFQQKTAFGEMSDHIILKLKPAFGQLPIQQQLTVEVTDAVLHHMPHRPLKPILPEFLQLIPVFHPNRSEPSTVKLHKGKGQAALLHLLRVRALHRLGVDEGQVVLGVRVYPFGEDLAVEGGHFSECGVDEEHAVYGLDLVGAQVA